MIVSGIGASPAESVYAALARAEDRLSRLDERVRSSGFVVGWRRRADIRAVLGAMSADGDVVYPEDLLLHELGADIRVPDPAVTKALRLMQGRRKAQNGGAELLSWSGGAWLTGLAPRAPPPGARPSTQIAEVDVDGAGYSDLARFFERLSKGHTEAPSAGVEECLAVLDLPGLAPLMQAAALLEAWRLVDPLPSHRWLGFLIASLLLRVCGRFSSGLAPIEVGLRRRSVPRRLDWAPVSERMVFWLTMIEAAANLELDELIRLGHMKTSIERKAGEGRCNSRAPDLARLAIEAPVMTTETISRSLCITPQASLQLVRRMDGVLKEITGRSRYRVWRL